TRARIRLRRSFRSRGSASRLAVRSFPAGDGPSADSLLRLVTTRPTAGTARGLQRILGLGFGLAVIVGSTIGIGILRTPGLVAARLGSPSTILIAWVAGGLFTLLGALCLTELGTMTPVAGGYYVYARRAFGRTLGFAVGWTDWVTYCAVL